MAHERSLFVDLGPGHSLPLMGARPGLAETPKACGFSIPVLAAFVGLLIMIAGGPLPH
jgi:hypothetical protein